MPKPLRDLLTVMGLIAATNVGSDPKNADYWARMRDKSTRYKPTTLREKILRDHGKTHGK